MASSAPDPEANREPPAPRRWWQSSLLRATVLVAAVLIVFVVARNWDRWTGGSARQRTDDAFLQTDVTPLGAKISGYVMAAPAGDFARVQRGDLLVAIDPQDYRAQAAQADAAVAAAEAALANNNAQTALQHTAVRAATAVIAGTRATLRRNRLEAARQRVLADDGGGTAQASETADTGERQVAAQLAQNEAQRDGAERQLDVLTAQRRQLVATLASAQAAQRLAQANLSYTRIVAPTDGTVTQRQVRPGQYIAAGQQVAVLTALPRIWVIANFKETQIGHMRVGQPADLAIDTFPGKKLRGHVVGFAPGTGSTFALLPPDNASGNFTKVVQRVAVKIAIDDPAGLTDLLRPGLSVVATVHTNAR